MRIRVAGSRWKITSRTDRCMKKENCQLPVNIDCSHLRYWMWSGWSGPVSSASGLRGALVEPVGGVAGGEERIYRREKVPEAVADGEHVGPLVEFDRRQEVPPLRLDVLVDADPLADVDLVLTRGQQL